MYLPTPLLLLFVATTWSSTENVTRKNLLIHAGPWKTGTTTIQKTLEKNSALLSELGVAYPLPHNSNHHYIVKYFTQQNFDVVDTYKSEKRMTFADMFLHLVWAVNNSTVSTVILSAESMTLIDAKTLSSLHTHFPAFDIHVIMFYRNPLAWVSSMYRQELLDSPTRTPISFSSYILQARGLIGSSLESYMLSFGKFIHIFGRERVHILDYDGFQRRGLNIMDAFFQVLGAVVKGLGGWPSSYSRTGGDAGENIGMQPREMYTRQMWQLFDMYCRQKWSCTTFSRRNLWSMKNRQLAETTFLGELVASFPTKCLHVDTLRTYCLELDHTFRQSYGDVVLFGDRNNTRELISSLQALCQVDVDQVLSLARTRWRKAFDKQMTLLKSNGVKCTRLERAL